MTMVDERPAGPNTWFKAADWNFAHRFDPENMQRTLCWIDVPHGTRMQEAESYDRRCPRCSIVMTEHAL